MKVLDENLLVIYESRRGAVDIVRSDAVTRRSRGDAVNDAAAVPTGSWDFTQTQTAMRNRGPASAESRFEIASLIVSERLLTGADGVVGVESRRLARRG